MHPTIQINEKGKKRLLKGHPWIFKSDLENQETSAGIVSIQDKKGKFLGKALYSPSSQIALRMLCNENRPIDEAFWEARILQAKKLRENLKIDSNAYRMIFGEADFIPSFVLDRYAEAYSFQILSAGLETVRETLLKLIEKHFSPQLLIERNDVSVRNLENLPQTSQILFGEKSSRVEIQEGKLHFEVDLLEGQKTGAFLDQRENRLWAASLAKKKKRVLDACAYLGFFSCGFAQYAEEVYALEQSEWASSQIQKNAELNKLKNIQIVTANVFDYLKEATQRKEKFDLINLDPPAFVKSRSQLAQALRGYKEINLRAMQLLTEGGVLISSSCSHHLSEEEFLKTLEEAALDAKKKIQILKMASQGPDHPILLGFPESKYLKCAIMKVL